MTGRDLFPESHEEVWGSEGAAADVGSKRARAGGQGLGAERECEASVSRRGCLQPYCWVAVETGQDGKAGWDRVLRAAWAQGRRELGHVRCVGATGGAVGR